jgi:hypothetical protein
VVKVPKIAVATIAGMLIITSICLIGCGSDASSASSSSKQSSTPAAQQQPTSSGQQPPARGNDQNMKNMLAKAAEILGISTDKLTSAFEAAQASMGPTGGQQPPQGGQPPTGQPPSGQQSQTGQQPTSGQQPTGQPPQGGPNMQALYDKMAETLGISADKIASAFEQAAKALQK